jgi:2-amino-4-hydroxy-6-hydroxymethyldihydropteridine diphosphokinase
MPCALGDNLRMHTAYIGLGGNVESSAGKPAFTLAAAVGRLASLGRVVRRSALYSTAPVGFDDQPRFVNAVVELETEMGPLELLGNLMRIELAFGRDRSEGIPNGPRTLDLDILLYGDVVIGELALEIPHPRLAERAFVLIPLGEIAPEVVEPRSGKRIAQLRDELLVQPSGDKGEVQRIREKCWQMQDGKARGGSPAR